MNSAWGITTPKQKRIILCSGFKFLQKKLAWSGLHPTPGGSNLSNESYLGFEYIKQSNWFSFEDSDFFKWTLLGGSTTLNKRDLLLELDFCKWTSLGVQLHQNKIVPSLVVQQKKEKEKLDHQIIRSESVVKLDTTTISSDQQLNQTQFQYKQHQHLTRLRCKWC